MFGQLFAQLAPLFHAVPGAAAADPAARRADGVAAEPGDAGDHPADAADRWAGAAPDGVSAGAIGILVPVITTVIGWITKFVGCDDAGVKWIVDGSVAVRRPRRALDHPRPGELDRHWFTSLWTNTKEIFTDLKNGVVAIWNGLWTTIKEKWNTFWSGLKNSHRCVEDVPRQRLQPEDVDHQHVERRMWTGPATRSRRSSPRSTARSPSSRRRCGTAFTNLKNSLGTIWDGIKSKIGNPVKFVVDTVYNNGIRKMWNSIAGKISSSKITLPAIKLGFNKGGVVPGSGNRDTVPAMLTPGERILSNSRSQPSAGTAASTPCSAGPAHQDRRQPHQPAGTPAPAGHTPLRIGGIVGRSPPVSAAPSAAPSTGPRTSSSADSSPPHRRPCPHWSGRSSTDPQARVSAT
jgi:hypothetical protein